ncbi:unnamed protein product [Auanema sp. JU1783]|nr:unnamed protein product [Auanema sp. JU1783]
MYSSDVPPAPVKIVDTFETKMSSIIQTYILSAAAIVTIPVYIRILVILIRSRKRERFVSQFYTISISHALIDIIGFFCYYTAFNMRGFDIFKPFFWSLNNTIFVQYTYMQTYFFLYARIIGIILISVQRCLTVSFPSSIFNYYLRQLPWWSFFVIQWIIPIPLCLPMFLVRMEFSDPIVLSHNIAEKDLDMHYIRSAIVPLLAMIICCICYGCIIYTFRQNRFHNAKKTRREIKLCLQVIGLQLGLLFITTHFVLQTLFVHIGATSSIIAMRSFLPLWVGFLTFINPWMMILVNQDVRSQLRTTKPSENSVFQVRNTASGVGISSSR